MLPQGLGCYFPGLITPTQLGLFVDSTPLGGAGGRGAGRSPSDGLAE